MKYICIGCQTKFDNPAAASEHEARNSGHFTKSIKASPGGYGISGQLTRAEYIAAVIDETVMTSVLDELHEQSLEMANTDGQQTDLDIIRNEIALTDLLVEELTKHAKSLTKQAQAEYEELGRETAKR